VIERTYNPDFINSVINDPSVRDGAEVKGIGDVSEIIRSLNNYVLVSEFGGFVGIKKMAGLYECHTQFLPEGRGEHAVRAARESLRYMFCWTDCERIITKVHADNRPAQLFAAQFFKKRGRTGDHFYYSLDVDDWIAKDPGCQMAGEEFHRLIGDKKGHDDDATHDCFAGYAWLAAKTGNIYKAQLQYNRWAVMAGYEPIIILSERPLVVSIGSMQIAMNQESITCL
jgi:hypothetical protein